MGDPIWLAVLGAAVVAFVLLRRAGLARTARERLTADTDLPAPSQPPARATSSVGVRGLAVGLGLAVAAALALATPLDDGLAIALGFVVLCITLSQGAAWGQRRALVIEGQIADALDLVVAALRSGTTVIEALESAAEELAAPVNDVVQEAAARLRLGEDTADVMTDVEAQLPLETTRLFAQALIVQSRTGSALVPALASVARAARDRIELARRVRAQTSEVRFSVAAVLAVTYGIAWLSWTTAPERVATFLTSSLGGSLVALCVALQGVGILWLDRLSRIDV